MFIVRLMHDVRNTYAKKLHVGQKVLSIAQKLHNPSK